MDYNVYYYMHVVQVSLIAYNTDVKAIYLGKTFFLK